METNNEFYQIALQEVNGGDFNCSNFTPQQREELIQQIASKLEENQTTEISGVLGVSWKDKLKCYSCTGGLTVGFGTALAALIAAGVIAAVTVGPETAVVAGIAGFLGESVISAATVATIINGFLASASAASVAAIIDAICTAAHACK